MCVLSKAFNAYITRKLEATHKEPRATAKAKGIYLRRVPEGILHGYLRNPTTEMLKFTEYCSLSTIVICNGSKLQIQISFANVQPHHIAINRSITRTKIYYKFLSTNEVINKTE